MSITTATHNEHRLIDFMRSITGEPSNVNTHATQGERMEIQTGDVEFTRLGQRYLLSVSYAEKHSRQQIGAHLYRVDSGSLTTLLSLAYADDSLAADIINMTIVADRNKSIEDDRRDAIDIIKTQIESAVHEH